MHTRGRLYESWKRAYAGGTTHTHAGQTKPMLCCLCNLRNHPCTRGADNDVVNVQRNLTEPSMHTRGRHSMAKPNIQKRGTIHAHAGQTLHTTIMGEHEWNHPCTRGADLIIFS